MVSSVPVGWLLFPRAFIEGKVCAGRIRILVFENILADEVLDVITEATEMELRHALGRFLVERAGQADGGAEDIAAHAGGCSKRRPESWRTRSCM